MANKFAEDIRRIARGTRFKGQLGEYSPRDPIGETQVALITDPLALGGGYNSSGGGLNNETPTSEAPNSETKQEENEGEENPPLDPNNPNSFYKGGAGDGADSAAGEGSFDVEDIIDGTAGPQTTIPGTSGGVNEITGMTDCESGTPFNLQLDGNFPVPEGWEDAETPPTDDSWYPGIYFSPYNNCCEAAAAAGSYRVDSFNQAAAVAESAAMGECWDNSFYTEFLGFTSGWERKNNLGIEPPPSGTYWQRSYQWKTIFDGTGNFAATIYAFSCSGSDLTDVCGNQYCSTVGPTDTAWPEDGTFELANKDGNLVTSKFDADAPAPYSSSGKDFCFGDGRTGKILVTADGGTMIYETNAEGAPTGTVRVYGPDGTAQGFGDATESFISQWLPK